MIINRTNQTRYLGLILDENLSWKYHINSLCNNLKRFFPSFYTLRNFISTIQAKSIYKAMIYSRLMYGISLYGTADKNVFKPLQIIQNKLLRVLTKKEYTYSTDKLHKDLDILKVRDLHEQEVLSFTYKFVNKSIPNAMKDHFTMVSDIHNVNTRNRNYNIKDPCLKSKIGKLAIKQKGATLWNGLKKSLKSSTSLKMFRLEFQKNKILQYTRI